MNRITTRVSLLILMTLIFSTAAIAGQDSQATRSSVDERWLPWIGCWRPAAQRAPEEGVHVCVVPAASNGVRILTIAGDQTLVDDTIVGDGAARSIDEPDCTGTRRAEWSSDGLRLYSHADVTCEKEARKISGMTLLSPGEWIDIQVVAVGNREDVRVRRYQRSTDTPPDPALIPPDLASRVARTALGSPLTIEHIKEASPKVSARVLEALLFETKSVFPIDSRQLIALDDAGVPDTVIDLMVAFAFPKKFEVKRSSYGGSGGGFGFGGFDWVGYGAGGWFMDPFFSPFGMGPYGYYDNDYYFFIPGAGVIVPGPGVGTAPSGHGRVVNGSGYTQVMPREPENGQAGSGSNGTRNRGAGADASSIGGSSSGSPGVSSGGYSSGGGGDTGRTAVPR
jgi:hypothetical protein